MGGIFSSNQLVVSLISKNSPSDIFVEVFEFLENSDVECCSLVCKKWEKIIKVYFRSNLLKEKQTLEIFKFLSRNDLDQCQMVSKFWNGTVRKYNEENLPLREVYYSIEQRRDDGVLVDNICDLETERDIRIERRNKAEEVEYLKNCVIKNANINFRNLPTGIREHFFLNKIQSPEELSIFYDGDLESMSLEDELYGIIQFLKFEKFWCGLYPTQEFILDGSIFELSCLSYAKEVIIFWENVNLRNFDLLLNFLFDSRGDKREKCDIVIKNVGLVVDYFVERFLHDKELDISGMFEEMEFTGDRDFFPVFYLRTNFENPSNFRNGKSILRLWMEDHYDADRVTMNAIVFIERDE